MKRRSFLTGGIGALGVGAASLGLGKPARAQTSRQLKMVTAWPKNLPGLGTSAERLAKRIGEATDGRITVRVFAAGELVPALEVFDAVVQGTADIYHGAEYYWQGKASAFNFFAAVPFGLTANEMMAWIYHGGGQELWDELSRPFNIKPFMAANTGVQMGGWYNTEINSPEDLKGLVIRMPGLGGEVLTELGATAVSLAGGEIFTALQSGNIDGTEWVGPWNDLAFGFYRIAKYYYYPGFHEPGTVLSAGINLELWDSLSASDQAIISDAMAAENSYALAEFNTRNGFALTDLIENHGVTLKRFSDETIAAIGTVSARVVERVGSENELSRRIYESYLNARTQSLQWGEIAEKAYWDARRLSS